MTYTRENIRSPERSSNGIQQYWCFGASHQFCFAGEAGTPPARPSNGECPEIATSKHRCQLLCLHGTTAHIQHRTWYSE